MATSSSSPETILSLPNDGRKLHHLRSEMVKSLSVPVRKEKCYTSNIVREEDDKLPKPAISVQLYRRAFCEGVRDKSLRQEFALALRDIDNIPESK